MNVLQFVLISVVVAAAIGGITNHLAIKMLFQPRNALVIWGRRVPFTPGLIPKRKDEIAQSLGRVVSEYLVTSSGLKSVLDKPDFRAKVEMKARQWVEKWTHREESLEELLLQIWSVERLEQAKTSLADLIRQMSAQGFDWIWEERGLARYELGALFPKWTAEHKEQLVNKGVEYLIAEVRKELASANGDKLLRRLTSQFMEQTGGLLGTLAGLFMDEGKMVQKVKVVLVETLESPAVKASMTGFFMRQIEQFEAKTLEEIADLLFDGQGKAGIKKFMDNALPWETWLDSLGTKPLSVFLAVHEQGVLQKVPSAVDFLLHIVAANMERIFTAIELPKLVEGEVRQFPIERLEQIILSVSGREFRAITWLGVLLGGIIGLIQSLLMQWGF